jgi:hypothetical protein
MGAKEKKVINELLLGVDENERLFRANAGRAWAGTVVRNALDKIRIAKTIISSGGNCPGILILRDARAFHGLPVGFPDLFGLKAVTITEDMVGSTLAVFEGIEVKTGRLYQTREQKLFEAMVKKMGGLYRLVRG